MKLGIFDYDGVIMDSFPGVHQAYKKICSELWAECPSDIVEFRALYLSYSDYTHFLLSLGIPKEKHKRANEIFLEELAKSNPQPFEGIGEVLRTLHNVMPLVLVSSNHTSEIEYRLKKNNLRANFDDVIGANSMTDYVPKTEAIKFLFKKFNVLPERAFLVEDRDAGYAEVRAAGLKNVIMADYGWGYHRKNLAEYKLKTFVKKPGDILSALAELEGLA